MSDSSQYRTVIALIAPKQANATEKSRVTVAFQKYSRVDIALKEK